MSEVSADMPDIAKKTTKMLVPLDEVGMSEVFTPINLNINQSIPTPSDGYKQKPTNNTKTLNSQLKMSINLSQTEARGIHMSRLYLICQKELVRSTLKKELVEDLLNQLIVSQRGLGETARIQLKFELPLNRPALLTELSGWKKYPVVIDATKTADEPAKFEIDLCIDYSSTCPCSLALSKRHVKDHFLSNFKDTKTISVEKVAQWLDSDGLSATPHGQRSKAFVKIFNPNKFSFVEWINEIEKSLSTPTQTAVKRLDEQKFAELSAANAMFAEDAARRVGTKLCSMKGFDDFELEVYHYESLHSHNAYAKTSSNTIKKFL